MNRRALLLDSSVRGGGGTLPLPARPTRDQACAVLNQLQGISVGDHHLFDPEIGWSDDKAFRLAAYAAHRAVRLPNGTPKPDTHVCLSLDMSGLAGLPKIKAVIREAITEGRMTAVLLMCMGDGNEAGKPNHDPGALNFPWLMANFPAIYAFMKQGEDLTPWIVFCPGFDGVIPGWQPWARVNEFLRLARAVIDAGGSGYLGLEFSAGYWSWSGERDDLGTPDGQMVDVVLFEFPINWGPPAAPPANLLLPDGSDWAPTTPNDQRDPWTQVWLMNRMIGARYIRPAMQPRNYEPNPAYANGDTPRGRKFFIMWERSTYMWCRQNCDKSLVDEQTQVVIDLGAEFF